MLRTDSDEALLTKGFWGESTLGHLFSTAILPRFRPAAQGCRLVASVSLTLFIGESSGHKSECSRAAFLIWSFFFLSLLALQPRPVHAEQEAEIPPQEQSEWQEDSKEQAEIANNETSHESPVQVHGFVDNILHYEDLLDVPSNWLVNTTRGTFRLFIEPARQIAMKVGVVGRMSHGTTDLNLAPFMPRPMWDALLPGAERYFYSHLENDLYLQEAYVTLKQESFWIRAGRQKFSTGTGYAFNPTDLFNQKNPIDPTYENDGIDAVRLGVQLTDDKEIGFFLSPSRSRQPGVLARLTSVNDSWEVSAQFTSVERFRTDWAGLNTVQGLAVVGGGDNLEGFSHGFRWNQPAIEFRKVWAGLEFYGEAGYVFVTVPDTVGGLVEDVGSHERVLVGIKPTLSERYGLILEYMRLGEGTIRNTPIGLNDMMGYFMGPLLTTNKDTFFAEGTVALARKIELQFQTIIGMNHLTVYLNPWLHFDVASGLRFSLSAYSNSGSADGANANVGLGGFVRLRWDF